MTQNRDLSIDVSDIGAAYQPSIRNYFSTEFPSLVTNPDDVLEAVFESMVGTKQTRFGPKPSPESQVAIRKVIRHAIEQDAPIPILAPWGSRKPNLDHGIDIAEVSALKILHCIAKGIGRYHKPGADIVVRLEDTGGFYVFADEGQKLVDHSVKYINDMRSLVKVLGYDKQIEALPESTLMSQEAHDHLAERVYPMFVRILTTMDSGKQVDASDLHEMAMTWNFRGLPSNMQREYYYSLYRKRHPEMSESGIRAMLARYFAGVVARHMLGATGARRTWEGKFIKTSFATPVPGTPTGMFDNTIYLRTVQERFSRNHIAPWRAHGYLRIREDGHASPAVASFYDSLPLVQSVTTLTGEAGESVNIATDYLP